MGDNHRLPQFTFESGKVQTPKYFKLKKYTLLVLLFLNIVLGLPFLYFAFQMAAFLLGQREESSEKMILLITAFGVIALAMIAFNLLMCYGVHQHHLCQVTLLVVVQVIVTLGLGLFFIGLVSLQGIILGPVVVAIVAFFFLRDIRQMKEQEQGKG